MDGLEVPTDCLTRHRRSSTTIKVETEAETDDGLELGRRRIRNQIYINTILNC